MVGGLVLAAVAVVLVAVTWVIWRAARRRWRALQRHTAVRSAAALWALARHGVGVSRPGWHGRASTAAVRRHLWRAVGAAEGAVRQAVAAGGAVGELPLLSRRLREVAAEVDRLLAMGDGVGPASPELQGARRQATDVVDAATSIRLAAIAAAGEVARTRARWLREDADREVRSLSAGLARARAAFPTPERT